MTSFYPSTVLRQKAAAQNRYALIAFLQWVRLDTVQELLIYCLQVLALLDGPLCERVALAIARPETVGGYVNSKVSVRCAEHVI